MASTIIVQGTPVEVDGKQTTEYARVKSSNIWSNVATALGAVVAFWPAVAPIIPQDSKWFHIGGALIVIAAQLKQMIVELGFQKARTETKATVMAAAAAPAVSVNNLK